MRLNHLDILEQVFREKFRGYSKQEVDTFLQLVSDDFKEMTEEIQQLQKKLEYKDRVVEKLQTDLEEIRNSQPDPASQITPEKLKEKAKRIMSVAREQAEQHKQRAQNELNALKREIQKMKQEKVSLMESIKAAAKAQLDSLHKTSPAATGNHDSENKEV